MFLKGLGITTAVNLLPLFILVVSLFNENLSASLVSLRQGDNSFYIAPLALWDIASEQCLRRREL